MEKVIKILMERDGLKRHEAIEFIHEAQDAMESCGYDSYQCEEIMRDYLGLEMDYLFDLIPY